MNAETLYEELKAFLRYAGISFHEKEQVDVRIENGKLRLSHGRISVYVDVNGDDND